MNKFDFITALSQKTEIPKYKVRKIIEAMPEVIADAVKSGNKIVIREFGTFKLKEVASRPYLDKKTGKTKYSKPHREIKFQISPVYKRSIEQGGET